MPKKADLQYFRAKGLLPFQAEFALSFLESEDETYWQLTSPTGMGKTHLGAALIAHELEEGPDKRILVLAPAALLIQWQDEISTLLSATEPSCKPVIVDRITYLELESKVSLNESPWPLSSIIVMSIDLAKRDDMASSVSTVTWDLIIFDESHLLSGGKRKALFDQLRKSEVARRGLLLTAIPKFFDNVVTKVTNWDVVDWAGRPLFLSVEKKLSFIYYQRNEEESQFFNELQEFARQLIDSFSYGKLQATSILRAASSSMYSLEGMLRGFLDKWRHLRNKIAHNVPWTEEDLERVHRHFSMSADEPAVVDELSEISTIQSQNFLGLYNQLESLLDQMEDVSVDSKLEAVISYARKFYEDKNRAHLCIWCSFANTVQYLSSSLQELGQPVWSITGSLKAVERMDSIESFREEGGILITTDVASEGVTLEYVDECINYDLPTNPQAFEQRWGRFIRLGRKSEFRMIVLRDESKALQWEEVLLRILEKLNRHRH